MRQTLQYSISVIIVLLTFASCRTVKEIQTSRGKEPSTEQSILKNILSQPENRELTSSLTISTSDLTIGGQLRMRWNSSIQISINMMGLMEIARIELLKDHLLIIDRVGRRYCISPYADLPYFNSIGIDFYSLQALLWNRAFSPGLTDPRQAIDRIETISQTNGATIFGAKRNKKADEYLCTFTANDQGSLTNTRMTARVEDSIYTLDFGYGAMEKQKKGNTIPTIWDIILRTTGQQADVNVKLNNITTESSDWPDETIVGSKYRQVTIEELLEDLR